MVTLSYMYAYCMLILKTDKKPKSTVCFKLSCVRETYRGLGFSLNNKGSSEVCFYIAICALCFLS